MKRKSATRIPKSEMGGMMPYQKFCYWVDADHLKTFREKTEQSGRELDDEARIPCRVLRASRQISCCAPTAWYGFCKRRTSWYWDSEKVGKYLIVSNSPLDNSDMGSPIIITESSFKPNRLPSPDEIAELVKSEKYQKRKPTAWEEVEPIDKDFYQTWFERHRPDEAFDFEKIFAHHSANHANFLHPKFFVNLNGIMVPYSIADSIHVCSSCVELFNILGEQWPVKYVVPCIGAVQFAHLPANQYFEVRTLRGKDTDETKP